MKISIIATIYKAERDLPRMLDSMMAQCSADLEFFLIDNGSPDRCGEICHDYATRDSRFVVRSLKENIGYIAARMMGIRECSGDYVGFADADDYIEPGGYDHAIEIIKKLECDLYIASYNTHSGQGTRINAIPFKSGLYKANIIEETIRPQAFGFLNGLPRLHGFMWKHIYRRKILIDKNITLDEKLKPWEDQLFNIDVIANCRRIFVDDKILYHYFANDDSLTAQMMADFKPESYWVATKNLYIEKQKRTKSQIESRANANAVMLNIYQIVMNLCKNDSISTFQVVRELRSLLSHDGVASLILKNSVASDLGRRMGFVRKCLQTNFYLLMVISIRRKLSRN